MIKEKWIKKSNEVVAGNTRVNNQGKKTMH